MWPSLQEFDDEIQNPYTCFIDPELRSGQPELTSIGLPKPRSGNFSTVYKIHSSTNQWAVKCFSKQIIDLSSRYGAIKEYLRKTNLPYFVDFEFLEQGILVRGQWYPILKMEWIEGESLDQFITRNIRQPHKLMELSDQLVTLIANLRRWNIAHGDLHHHNILIVNGQLKLIDYDGMFVPSLAGRISHEIGHIHYQHPLRTPYDFGPFLDHFPAWNIYITLRALSISPSLWSNHQDDYLLFRREDYINPESSDVIKRLAEWEKNDVALFTSEWKSFCYSDLAQIPPLPHYMRVLHSHETPVSQNKPNPLSQHDSAANPSWIFDYFPPISLKAKPFSYWPERILISIGISIALWGHLLPINESVKHTFLILVAFVLTVRFFMSPGIKQKVEIRFSLIKFHVNKFLMRVQPLYTVRKIKAQLHQLEKTQKEHQLKLNTIYLKRDQSIHQLNQECQKSITPLSLQRQKLNITNAGIEKGQSLLDQQLKLKQNIQYLVQEIMTEFEPSTRLVTNQMCLIQQQLNDEIANLKHQKEKQKHRISSLLWQIDQKKHELRQLKQFCLSYHMRQIILPLPSRKKREVSAL